MGNTLSLGLHRGVSHSDHPVGPAHASRRLPPRSGYARLWIGALRVCRTTLSAGTDRQAYAGEAVGGRSYRRSDWILRGPVDGLLRGQCSPDPRLEGTSDTHVLGAAQLIALPFLVVSLSRFAPETARHAQLDSASK